MHQSRGDASVGFSSAHSQLVAAIGGDEIVLARLAAPLWARVGRPLTREDLSWARAFGNETAVNALWEALTQAGVLSGSPPILRAAPLAHFLVDLADGCSMPGTADTKRAEHQASPRLVWTLPQQHVLRVRRGATYLESAMHLISNAQHDLTLVAPYLEVRGIGLLFNHLIEALVRGVKLVIITHDALNLASLTSHALQDLRRQAERLSGHFAIYSAGTGSGGQSEHPLMHAKIILADVEHVLIGSANLTVYGLSSNLEAGVLLGRPFATEVAAIIDDLIESNLVYPAVRLA